MPKKRVTSREEVIGLWKEYVKLALFKCKSKERKFLLLSQIWLNEKPIEELRESEYIGAIFDLAITNSREVNGKEPSIEEAKNELINFFQKRTTTRFYMVRLFPPLDAKEVSNLFYQLIKKAQSEPEVKEYIKKHQRWFFRTKPIRYDEVKRYSEVYRLHKIERQEWPKVAAKVYPKELFNKELGDTLRAEEKKAQKIIENVKQGIFPGYYQSKKKKIPYKKPKNKNPVN